MGESILTRRSNTKNKIFGLIIDENNSNPLTSITYTDDAVGIIPASFITAFDWGGWEKIIKDDFGIKPCLLKNNGNGNADVNYFLNYDNYTKKENGENSNLTGSDGDVGVLFSKILWYKIEKDANQVKIKISNAFFQGAVKNVFEIEKGYNLMPFYATTLLQILGLLIFKNRNIQLALGRGYVDSNLSYLNTGGTNSKSFFFGESSGKQQVKFLGIEDFYGNRSYFLDGIYFSSNTETLIAKRAFNTTGEGYEKFGKINPQSGTIDLNGYVGKVHGDNNLGLLPSYGTGSTTTQYCDYVRVLQNNVAMFGGSLAEGSFAGMFYLRAEMIGFSNAIAGGRLFYSNGVDKIFIGAYLGVSSGGKLRSISGYVSHSNVDITSFRVLAKANN